MVTELDPRLVPRQERIRAMLVVVLAIHSGTTDAIGFIALGGAFTSVMTGNMVLIGVAAAQPDGQLALHAGAAVICFTAGCAVGARLAGRPQAEDPLWPVAVTRALTVELTLVTIFAVGWELTGSEPAQQGRLLLLMLNAVALGVQSSAIQRFGVSGLSTTYLTGTLTTVVIKLATGGHPREVSHSAQILVGLIAGAAGGGLLTLHQPRLAPILQLLCLGGVILSACWRLSGRGPALSERRS